MPYVIEQSWMSVSFAVTMIQATRRIGNTGEQEWGGRSRTSIDKTTMQEGAEDEGDLLHVPCFISQETISHY